MITKQQKFRLGVFLIVASILLVSIFAVFVITKFKSKGDTYYINFKGMSVNGVYEGADVKYQGVKIGKVHDLEVNAEDLNSIIITVKIRKGFPVKEDMRAALQYAGITGLKFIEISGGSVASKLVEPKGWISAQKGLGEKAEDIVFNIDSVVRGVNQLLSPENRKKISQVITNLENSSGVLANVLEKREEQLLASLEKLDQILTRLNEVVDKMDKFMTHLNKEMENISLAKISSDAHELIKMLQQRFSKEEFGKVLDDIDGFVKTADTSLRKLETRLQDLESEMIKTLEYIQKSMDNLSQFTRDLVEDPTILLRKRPGKRSQK